MRSVSRDSLRRVTDHGMQVGLWMYPWDLLDLGPERVAAQLSDFGIASAMLATAYHSVSVLAANNPHRPVFVAPRAALYFSPDPDEWSRSPVQHHVADLIKDVAPDPLVQAREALVAHGVGLTGWTVFLHASAVAAAHPDAQLDSAIGRVPNLFCVRSPSTRAFAAALARDVGSRVDVLQAEALHWMAPLHAHHPKTQVLAPELLTLITSWCMCEHCSAAIGRRGADPDRLRAGLVEVAMTALRGPDGAKSSSFGEARELIIDRLPDAAALDELREEAVTELITLVAEESPAPVEITIPGDRTVSGLDARAAAELSSRIRVLAYGGLPLVEPALEALATATDDPSRRGLGLSMLPGDVDARHEFDDILAAVDSAGIPSIGLYHYGMMPPSRLDWLQGR
jgi:hypothetical protein